MCLLSFLIIHHPFSLLSYSSIHIFVSCFLLSTSQLMTPFPVTHLRNYKMHVYMYLHTIKNPLSPTSSLTMGFC